MPRNPYFWAVLAILLLALTLRCAAAVWWQSRLDRQGQHFAFGDSESYWVLGNAIAVGQPYRYGSDQIFRVPLYPMLISCFVDPQTPYGGVLNVRLLGCLLGTLAVAGIMGLAYQTFGPAAALMTGVLAAMYPGAISMSIFVLSEAPFCPLMVGNLLLWRKASISSQRTPLAGWSLAAGCVAGLAVLTRPSWLLFAPFACGFELLRGKPARVLLMFLAMMTGFAATMSPWWVRNYRLTGHFVLSTLQVGPSMYDGLHPGATGASDTGMAFMTRFSAEQRLADAATAHPDSTFEYRVNARAGAAARRWALGHRADVARLALVKIWRTWRPWSTAQQTSSPTLRIAAAVGLFAIVPPALITTLRRRRQVSDLMLLWMPALYFTCLHAVFIGSMRYRLPAVFVLTILAGPFWLKFVQPLFDRDLSGRAGHRETDPAIAPCVRES